MAATMAPAVIRIIYKRAMLSKMPVGDVPTVVIERIDIPAALVTALQAEDVASLGGRYGEPRWASPIEYDHVVVEHAGGRTEIEVFNRAIHIMVKDSAKLQRVFRVCEAVRAACERPTDTAGAADTGGAVDAAE